MAQAGLPIPRGLACVFIDTYLYTYIHIYKYTHIHTYIYTYIHIYIYTYIHIYIYTYIHTCVCIHKYIYVCMHIYMYIYMFIYACVDIHMYVYIHWKTRMACQVSGSCEAPIRLRRRQRLLLAYVHTCINICTYISHVYVHVCKHMYIYIYVFMYTHICIYVYSHRWASSGEALTGFGSAGFRSTALKAAHEPWFQNETLPGPTTHEPGSRLLV